MLEKEKVIFEDESYEVEMDSRDSEFIAAAFNSLGAIDLLDTGLMDADEKTIIKTIQFQAISIISESLNNIYEQIFDTSIDDDDDLVL
jgi:hypothetical protein